MHAAARSPVRPPCSAPTVDGFRHAKELERARAAALFERSREATPTNRRRACTARHRGRMKPRGLRGARVARYRRVSISTTDTGGAGPVLPALPARPPRTRRSSPSRCEHERQPIARRRSLRASAADREPGRPPARRDPSEVYARTAPSKPNPSFRHAALAMPWIAPTTRCPNHRRCAGASATCRRSCRVRGARSAGFSGGQCGVGGASAAVPGRGRRMVPDDAALDECETELGLGPNPSKRHRGGSRRWPAPGEPSKLD